MHIFTVFASVALNKEAALHVNSSCCNWEFPKSSTIINSSANTKTTTLIRRV